MTDGRAEREEFVEGRLGLAHVGAGTPSGEIPAAEALEVSEGGGAAEPPAHLAGRAQQVEVVADQPDDAPRGEAGEQVGADLVVVGRADGLADVVQQGGRPERRVAALAPRDGEGLHGVEEGAALGVVAEVLPDPVEPAQHV